MKKEKGGLALNNGRGMKRGLRDITSRQKRPETKEAFFGFERVTLDLLGVSKIVTFFTGFVELNAGKLGVFNISLFSLFF